MEAKATAKFVRIASNKARKVVDLIRGTHVEEARRILRFSSLGPAETVAKVLNSAVANAESLSAGAVAPTNLRVARAYVDEGPTLRRFRPRAQGRATRIRKRTSHITVIVESMGEVVGAQG
jgi:large subunit ribosomal protein L22